MANVYKNIQTTVISSAGSDVSMYTSPTATTSIIKTIRLFNTHGSAHDFDKKLEIALLTLILSLVQAVSKC